jgi:hypothetical protein
MSCIGKHVHRCMCLDKSSKGIRKKCKICDSVFRICPTCTQIRDILSTAIKSNNNITSAIPVIPMPTPVTKPSSGVLNMGNIESSWPPKATKPQALRDANGNVCMGCVGLVTQPQPPPPPPISRIVNQYIPQSKPILLGEKNSNRAHLNVLPVDPVEPLEWKTEESPDGPEVSPHINNTDIPKNAPMVSPMVSPIVDHRDQKVDGEYDPFGPQWEKEVMDEAYQLSGTNGGNKRDNLPISQDAIKYESRGNYDIPNKGDSQESRDPRYQKGHDSSRCSSESGKSWVKYKKGGSKKSGACGFRKRYVKEKEYFQRVGH